MIAIVDYGIGNLGSIAKALQYVGGDVLLTSDPKEIERAERIVVPGVGAFGDGMKNLQERGLIDVLHEQAMVKKKPFWGICLGMQFMMTKSFEFGEHQGLGWIAGEVRLFDPPPGSALKIPHVGWNDVRFTAAHPMLDGIKNPADFYFVHSYHTVPADPGVTIGTCTYGYEFAAAIAKDNLFATQFHPEKSQKDGLKMLENFLTWTC